MQMDPLTRAANLEDCAYRWRAQARMFSGRRRAWRLARANYLMKLAWSLID
jgi:hypothetical protein